MGARACLAGFILAVLVMVSGCAAKPQADVALSISDGGAIEQAISVTGIRVSEESSKTLAPAGWTVSERSNGQTFSRRYKDLKDFAAAGAAATDALVRAFESEAGYAPDVIEPSALRVAWTDYFVARRYDVRYTLPVIDFKPKQCPTCSGTGDVDCLTCSAKGLVKCSDCSGVGRLTCESCGGKPSSRCSSCSGTGHYTSFWGTSECYSCAGTGRIQCPWCSGTGKIVCRACDGAKQVTCGKCGGEGHSGCSDCAGSGRPSDALIRSYTEKLDAASVRVSIAMPGFGAQGEAAESGNPLRWVVEGSEVEGGLGFQASSWVVNWPVAGTAAAVGIGIVLGGGALIARSARRRIARKTAPAVEPAAVGASLDQESADVSDEAATTGNCGACGSVVSVGASFCRGCGAPVSRTDKTD